MNNDERAELNEPFEMQSDESRRREAEEWFFSKKNVRRFLDAVMTVTHPTDLNKTSCGFVTFFSDFSGGVWVPGKTASEDDEHIGSFDGMEDFVTEIEYLAKERDWTTPGIEQ